MALLQDPIKVLDQIEHHLASQPHDAFPGASLLSAGNLCRQLVEQLAFLLCVYGGVPRAKFLKPDGRLKLLNEVLTALEAKDANTNRTYWTMAKRRGQRIAKFATMRPSLNKWRDWFNEPSHYSAPGHRRRIGEGHVRECVRHLRGVIDRNDFGLVVAAYNDIMSDGSIPADLTGEPDHLPAIRMTRVARIRDIALNSQGRLELHFAHGRFDILPEDAETHPRKLKGPAIVRGEVAPVLAMQFVNEKGRPIDLTNFETILRSLITDRRDIRRVQRRMRRLGLSLHVAKNPHSHRMA